MTIDLETIVELVVRETVNELMRLGVDIGTNTSGSGRDRNYPLKSADAIGGVFGTASGGTSPVASGGTSPIDRAGTRIPIDLSNYATPVLTEGRVASLSDDIREIVIPPGTVITPGAREVIKQRNLAVII